MPSKKDLKTEVNKKRKQSMEEIENDEGNRDWWTKYFASIEAMIEVTISRLRKGRIILNPLAIDSRPA